MAITRRIKPPPVSEAAVDAVIGRGLAQPSASTDNLQKSAAVQKSFTLRAPAAILDRIAAAASRRPGKVSTNTWVLEAIEEKFQRDGEVTSK